MSKKSFIKNLEKAFQTRAKLGDILTTDSFRYFTKCSAKEMFENGYIEKEKCNLLNSSGEVEVLNMPCYRFTNKFDKAMARAGYPVRYNSCSDTHDIMLSNNVYKFAKDSNFSIEDYICEKDLDKSSFGYSRPDGAFCSGGRTILIEQTTEDYTPIMIQDKKNYANEFGYDIKIF